MCVEGTVSDWFIVDLVVVVEDVDIHSIQQVAWLYCIQTGVYQIQKGA